MHTIDIESDGTIIPQKLNQKRKNPKINVINKEELHERTGKVFAIMGEKLANSFGPGGAPTIISQYPYHHITKDGFTIQKSLEFEKEESYLDQIIADMAKNICGRLNFSVGDGTTTAMIATNSTYQSYLNRKEFFDSHHYLPRDIMKAFNVVKDKLIEEVRNKAIKINVEDNEKLAEYIRNVVYISSNANDELTNIITDLYRNLGYPAINVSLSPDGITRSSIIEGFQNEAVLLDQLYINTDDMTMDDKDVDVLIYDHKITLDTYKYTLRPLASMCRNRGRHLVVLAPLYDEMALQTTIAGELKKEYQQTRNISLVLLAYKNHSAAQKKMIGDLAMLCDTEIINKELDRELNERMQAFFSHQNPLEHSEDFPFNLDDRDIDDLNVQIDTGEIIKYEHTNFLLRMVGQDTKLLFEKAQDKTNVGYCGEVSLGMKSSIFKNFLYDEELYKLFLSEAERELKEAELKYQKLGTFNLEIANCQQRVNGLKLKLGNIEVGSDSEFSKNYMKDTVDDAVKAAKSAYNHGIILGCNLTLIQCINECINAEIWEFESLEHHILDMLFDAFCDVYRTVLNNAYPEMPIIQVNDYLDEVNDIHKTLETYVKGKEKLDIEDRDINRVINNAYPEDLKDFIITYSVIYGKVYDISTGTFSNDVVNSSETDVQVLRAVVDLMSLLITGNQLVISQFEQF